MLYAQLAEDRVAAQRWVQKHLQSGPLLGLNTHSADENVNGTCIVVSKPPITFYSPSHPMRVEIAPSQTTCWCMAAPNCSGKLVQPLSIGYYPTFYYTMTRQLYTVLLDDGRQDAGGRPDLVVGSRVRHVEGRVDADGEVERPAIRVDVADQVGVARCDGDGRLLVRLHNAVHVAQRRAGVLILVPATAERNRRARQAK